MNFIDTHTHLYAEEFSKDPDRFVHNAVASGITRLMLPAIDISWYQKMMDLVHRHPEHCFPMIGLHPTSVKGTFRRELDFVKTRLEEGKEKFYGIGEIGIDLYWDARFWRAQEEAFSVELDLAVQYDLPAIIHTRNSFEHAMKIIRKKNDPRLKGIFHCFSGTAEQAHEAIEVGFLLGIGGVVTYKNSGLPKVVEVTKLEHMVLETDSPWLPPVPYRGQRNESAYIPLIAQKIAEIKNLTIDEVASVTTKNAERIFKIDAGC